MFTLTDAIIMLSGRICSISRYGKTYKDFSQCNQNKFQIKPPKIKTSIKHLIVRTKNN